MMKPLITLRLCLRHWTIDETNALIKLCRSDGLNKFFSGRYDNMDSEKAEAFINAELDAGKEGGLGRLGVFLIESNTPIGFCGLYKMEDPKFINRIGLGYRVSEFYWGLGYATEAARAVLDYGFNDLHLEEISAIIDPKNPRSSRVVEKLGMTLVGEALYRGQVRLIFQAQSRSK